LKTSQNNFKRSDTTVTAGDMPYTKEQMKRRRVDAGDEGRAKDAARKKRRRAEANDKPVDERSKLYRLIKSRVMRLADLDIAADDASLDKLNLDELDDLKKLLDKHLERASSQNLLPMTI
jgi:hypothetical protein